MSTIAELQKLSVLREPIGANIGLQPGQAYSSFYPAWETQTPQYIQPSIYSTEQTAFRQNEFVYSLIIRRAKAEGKGSLRVWDGSGKIPVELKDHKLRKLIRHPNKLMTENDFWGMKRVSQDLAGFAAFEIEYNRIGDPIHLWYMRPDWCSFLRGLNDPLAFIRYQPWGLNPMDIPLVDESGRLRILFFSNVEDFDPLYPGVKFYSPAMHALPQINFDNAMTFFLDDFVKHGAKPSGLISVQQTLDPNKAEELRNIWRIQHGGAQNWSDPIFLGLGATYAKMQMDFKDMAFPELDGRFESRVCETFNIPAIVADARVGLDVSTYNNVQQAVKDWYHDWVSDTWDANAETITQQMLPVYGDDPDVFYCDFNISRVNAMQEDVDMMHKRAQEDAKIGIITRDEAREMINLDPIDNDDVWLNVTVREQVQTDTTMTSGDGGVTQTPAPKTNATTMTDTPAQEAAKKLEIQQFVKMAKKRVKEGKKQDLLEYEFKFIDTQKRRELLAQFGVAIPEDAEKVVNTVRVALQALAELNV